MFKAVARRRVTKNKHAGSQFEKLFEHRAQLTGLLVLRNELSFRYQGGGKMLPIRADLDYRVCQKNGQVGFFDLKCFDAAYFTYSQITLHQLQRARIYENYNVPAGFVVCFRPLAQVVYYSGGVLTRKGPRSRFTPEDGVLLGSTAYFDLRLVFLDTGPPG